MDKGKLENGNVFLKNSLSFFRQRANILVHLRSNEVAVFTVLF